MLIFSESLPDDIFVVFNVEYRRGKIFDNNDPNLYTVQQILTIYRGFQDARGAIRSIIKRQNNENTFNDPYRIDVNNIFLAGASAGSVIALSAAYYNSTMIDKILPNISASLGPLDANYYYGGAGIEYSSKIKGVLNQWGNVFVPYSLRDHPVDFFINNAAPTPPLISFHGENDNVATFNKMPINFSTTAVTNSESDCVNSTYTLDNDPNSADLEALGSNQLYKILKDPNILKFTELYLDCDAGHGLRNPGSRGFYGTCSSNTDVAETYIAERTATFFQAILTNHTNIPVVSKFTSCRNSRFGCQGVDSNDGCTDSDGCPNNKPCP